MEEVTDEDAEPVESEPAMDGFFYCDSWDSLRTGLEGVYGDEARLMADITPEWSDEPLVVPEGVTVTLNLNGYAEARKTGKIIPIDTRDLCRSLDPEVKFMSWEAHPASLEAWAQRRGTLAADEAERHLGLDDTDLMFRTVLAELKERNLLK